MKIVILDGYTENPGDLSWDAMAALGDLIVYDRTPTEAEAIERIGDAEIIITNKTPITRSLLEACPSVRYVGALSTGYNIIDGIAARERGIPVTNIPAYSTDSVAQLTFALLLEICHHVGDHDRSVHAGDWAACKDFTYWLTPLMELKGKTMGIIGFGSIGQAVAKIAAAFGMRVLAYSRTVKPGAEFVALEELLAQSDVVSLHCPLFPETTELICRRTIEKMKDGAILINTGRGALINEQDVADSLNSGKLYAAAMDVVSVEPISPNNPLLHAKNCILTPHIAWAPKEARQRLMDIAVGNVQAFLDGTPRNVVNP